MTEKTYKKRRKTWAEDISNQRYNGLIALRFDHSRHAGTSSEKDYWLFRCDCGREKVISKQNVINGHTKSCGCLQKSVATKQCKERTLPNGQSSLNVVYGRYKRGAHNRDLEFALSKEVFESLIKKDCTYCGAPPRINYAANKKRNPHLASITYNGIDRIDSSKGYIESNICTCCYICNFAKGEMSLEEFGDWVKQVYAFMFNRGCPLSYEAK